MPEHKPATLFILCLLGVLLTPASFAQSGGPAAETTTSPYTGDFYARGEAIWLTGEGALTLELTYFYRQAGPALLVLLTAPSVRKGLACLLQGEKRLMYYPAYDLFLEPVGEPLLFFFPYPAANPFPETELQIVRRSLLPAGELPVEWSLTSPGPPLRQVQVRLTDVQPVRLPEFIFTKAYLQLINGH